MHSVVNLVCSLFDNHIGCSAGVKMSLTLLLTRNKGRNIFVIIIEIQHLTVTSLAVDASLAI